MICRDCGYEFKEEELIYDGPMPEEIHTVCTNSTVSSYWIERPDSKYGYYCKSCLSNFIKKRLAGNYPLCSKYKEEDRYKEIYEHAKEQAGKLSIWEKI